MTSCVLPCNPANQISFEKGFTLKRKYKEEIFFPFRVVPSEKERQNNFDRGLSSFESVSIPL